MSRKKPLRHTRKQKTFGLLIEYRDGTELAKAIRALNQYLNPGWIEAEAHQAFWDIQAQEAVRELVLAYNKLGDYDSLRDLRRFALGQTVNIPVSAVHLLAGCGGTTING